MLIHTPPVGLIRSGEMMEGWQRCSQEYRKGKRAEKCSQSCQRQVRNYRLIESRSHPYTLRRGCIKSAEDTQTYGPKFPSHRSRGAISGVMVKHSETRLPLLPVCSARARANPLKMLTLFPNEDECYLLWRLMMRHAN